MILDTNAVSALAAKDQKLIKLILIWYYLSLLMLNSVMDFSVQSGRMMEKSFSKHSYAHFHFCYRTQKPLSITL